MRKTILELIGEELKNKSFAIQDNWIVISQFNSKVKIHVIESPFLKEIDTAVVIKYIQQNKRKETYYEIKLLKSEWKSLNSLEKTLSKLSKMKGNVNGFFIEREKGWVILRSPKRKRLEEATEIIEECQTGPKQIEEKVCFKYLEELKMIAAHCARQSSHFSHLYKLNVVQNLIKRGEKYKNFKLEVGINL